MIDWGTVAAIATAIGVCFAAWELRQGWELSQTQFEDSLDQQFQKVETNDFEGDPSTWKNST